MPYIDANPCFGIKPPKSRRGPALAFSRVEAERVLAELREPYRTAVLVMLFMGLRFGEMAPGRVAPEGRGLPVGADPGPGAGRDPAAGRLAGAVRVPASER